MRVGVLILNTNAWKDTIECLESVFRSTGPEFTVVVCDNDSQDGSLSHVKEWAEGRLNPYVASDNPLRALSFPPVPKPIPLAEYDRAAAERGGDPTVDARLVLIQNGGNLGFSGGNNVGLSYLMKRGDFDFVWLLNPDTVVHPEALQNLVKAAMEPGVGMCGSTVLYYGAPDTVQVLGGARYNRWLALPSHIGAGQSARLPVDEAAVKSRMTYVYGASMLVSRAFLEEIGLLNDEYFLYFDELDWAMRAEGKFRLAYAPNSIVYHREGGILGAGRAKSWTSDYYFLRNRIRVTRKFNPAALPTVYLALLVSMLRRAQRGQWDRVRMIAKLLVSG